MNSQNPRNPRFGELRDEEAEISAPEIKDECWDAFLPDEDQRDLLPEPGDFWIEDELQEARRPAA